MTIVALPLSLSCWTLIISQNTNWRQGNSDCTRSELKQDQLICKDFWTLIKPKPLLRPQHQTPPSLANRSVALLPIMFLGFSPQIRFNNMPNYNFPLLFGSIQWRRKSCLLKPFSKPFPSCKSIFWLRSSYVQVCILPYLLKTVATGEVYCGLWM